MATTLGVSTLAYAPWTFFNYLMPLTVLLMTALGWLTVKISDEPDTVNTPAKQELQVEGPVAGLAIE
jgi:Na+/H+ antiporter NhaC